MVAHDRSRELAAIALDFDLSADERVELDGHLAACEACRRYAEALAGDVVGLMALPTFDAPERVRRRVLGEGRRPRLSTTSWAAIAAVIVLTVLPLATAVVFLRGIGGGSIGAAPGAPESIEPSVAATGAPSASQAPAASATPVPPVDPAQLAWQAVELPPRGELPQVTMLNAVVHAPALSWYAVGAACGRRTSPEEDPREPSLCAPAVLRSEDGIAWDRVPNVTGLTESFERPGPPAAMYDIVAGGPGLVAVGVTNEGPDSHPAVWISSDGHDWERVFDDDLRGGWMTAATVLPDGTLVAVGSANDPMPPVPAAWRSGPDGRSWERIPASGVGGSQNQFGLATDVTVLGADPIGIGNSGRADPATAFGLDAAARWGPISAPNAFAPEDWYAEAITTSASGQLVAVGWRRPVVEGPFEQLIAWRSEDGVAWELGTFDPVVVNDRTSGGQGLSAVAALGDTFIAGGAQPGGPPGLWVSQNGLDWAIAPGSEPIGTGDVYGLAAGEGRMVGVGESAPRGGEPAIWVGLPQGETP